MEMKEKNYKNTFSKNELILPKQIPASTPPHRRITQTIGLFVPVTCEDIPNLQFP